MESDKLIQLYLDNTVDGMTSIAGMSAMAQIFLLASEEERDKFLDFLHTEKELAA